MLLQGLGRTSWGPSEPEATGQKITHPLGKSIPPSDPGEGVVVKSKRVMGRMGLCAGRKGVPWMGSAGVLTPLSRS